MNELLVQIVIGGLVFIAGYFGIKSYIRKKTDEQDVQDLVEHVKKDIKLETKQKASEEKIKDIKRQMEESEERLKKMTPEEIEDFWNKK